MMFGNRFFVSLLLTLVGSIRGGMDMGGTKKDFIELLSAAGSLSAAQAIYIRDNFLVFFEDEDEATLTNVRSGEEITVDLAADLRFYLEREVENETMDYSIARYTASVFGIEFSEVGDNPIMRQAMSGVATADYAGNGNVRLFGRSDPDPVPTGTNFGVNSKKYNGIWGYATGDREYALQCNSNGLHIIDVTVASDIFRVQFIPMPGGTTWRDVETYEASDGITYAYVAAQNRGELWVVNLSYLSSTIPHDTDEDPIPSEGGYVNRGRMDDGHTVSVYNGLLFLNTASPNRGCQILDLREDPWDPPFIKAYSSGFFGFFNGKDCHDSIAKANVDVGNGVRKDILISSDGNSGRFRIADLENVRDRGNLRVIGETPAVANSYAHFNVVTEDMKYLIGFDEFDSYDMSVYDISDVTNPRFLRFLQYSDDDIASARVHNGQVRGDYLFVAYYEAGFRVFDLSGLPDTIAEVGKYETYRDPDQNGGNLAAIQGDFNGGWNVYSYLPSGKVLHSDMNNGLFVFEIEGDDSSTLPTTPAPTTTGGTPASPAPVSPAPVSSSIDSPAEESESEEEDSPDNPVLTLLCQIFGVFCS